MPAKVSKSLERNRFYRAYMRGELAIYAAHMASIFARTKKEEREAEQFLKWVNKQ